MSVAVMSRFFALLSLLAAFGTVALVVLGAWSSRALGAVRADVQRTSLWLAWTVAAVTTLGSLYYSLVAHFEPCELCWYQRICVYPLSVVLLIAALRRDYRIWMYVAPLVVVGIVIAGYHTQLQAFPEQQTFCSTTVPCTARYVWEFGFVSLPFMDLTALSFIAACLWFSRRQHEERIT